MLFLSFEISVKIKLDRNIRLLLQILKFYFYEYTIEKLNYLVKVTLIFSSTAGIRT